jgi:hypothetical protein
MKETDILSKYIEALTNHMPDNQAQLFARSWAEASEPHPSLATKHELELAIERINSTVSKLSLGVYSIFLVLIIEIIKEWIFK